LLCSWPAKAVFDGWLYNYCDASIKIALQQGKLCWLSAYVTGGLINEDME
jgi:hypothetical protein